MPSKLKAVKTYLTQGEYDQVVASAAQAGVSVSTFIKRVCLAQEELRSTADQQAVLALLRANADLGRLGGLFKMALSEGTGKAEELRPILRGIEQSQKQVVRQIDKVAEKFSNRNRRGGK
ncbi:plasmid mobilization protein [Desulfobulbus elongatus]|uniref:plasmid mobilization protein n=1 Tax=Desulfobulbus elongatus TaxID=53332 RepID=UPI0006859E0C|nr:hypothetical protein [Desulfobulbus elongatus]